MPIICGSKPPNIGMASGKCGDGGHGKVAERYGYCRYFGLFGGAKAGNCRGRRIWNWQKARKNYIAAGILETGVPACAACHSPSGSGDGAALSAPVRAACRIYPHLLCASMLRARAKMTLCKALPQNSATSKLTLWRLIFRDWHPNRLDGDLIALCYNGAI